MSKFFKYDSGIFKLASLIFDLFLLTFLWIVFSIPLITIGASTVSLFYVVSKLVRDKNISIFSDFIKGFKENFKQATILNIIVFILGAILYINIRNIKQFGSFGRILLPLFIAISIEIFIILIYSLPMIALYKMPLINILKNSFMISSKLCLGISIVFYYITKTTKLYIFICAYVYIIFFIIYKVFKRYEKLE